MEIIQIVKNNSLSFLQKLYKGEGFFSYTLSSDLYDKSDVWGLGNAVFAVKTYFILNHLDSLNTKMKNDIVRFIRSFQKKGGIYSDPLVKRKTFLINKLGAIKNGNFSNFWGQKTEAAETRQAIVALLLLGEKPEEAFTQVPYTIGEVDKYLNKLNWRNMWGAASHINHLLFFYKMNSDLFNYREEEGNTLIRYCLEKIDSLQKSRDGMWYRNEVSIRQKVNAAMKIISGFNVVGRINIRYAERIIDFMMGIKDDYYSDGCDNLNAMFVLKYSFESTGNNYRKKEVKRFCERALDGYKKYLSKEDGGICFFPNNSPRNYYGMRITNKFFGPDIHGTMLFVWAISLAASILGIYKDSFQDIIN